MSNLNKVLLALLALQIAIVGLVYSRSEEGTLGKLEPLLEEFDVDSVTRVQIFGERGAGDAAAPAVDLENRDGEWVVASHFDYPADGTAIRGLLGKFASMRSRGPSTTNASRHKQLEVAEDAYVRKVVITSAGGETTLYMGIAPKFRKLTVRLAGSDETHQVSRLSATDAADEMAAWIDPVYLEIPEATMAALSVENASGSISLERDADKRWQLAEGAALPPGKTAPVSIDQKSVEEITKKLARIEIEEVVGGEAKPEFGLEKPRARITVGLAGDSEEAESPPREIRIIEIGAEIAGNYCVRALDKPHIVMVKKDSLSGVVEWKLEKVLDEGEPAPVAPQP